MPFGAHVPSKKTKSWANVHIPFPCKWRPFFIFHQFNNYLFNIVFELK